MDPSRHHEFLNNNDDRSRAPYYGRDIQEIASHHYYAPSTTTTRTVSQTRKPCGCTTTGSATTAASGTCNGCRLQPPADDSWSPAMATTQQTEQHNQRIGVGGGGGGGGGVVGDYGRMAAETSVRSNMRQSPMFIQQHTTQQQQQQHNGPPPSMVQPQQHPTHVGNMGNRTSYWPQANSSTQPYHAEDHLGGIPIQPHIDVSGTRRPQPPAMDSVYGQYKPVTSMTGSNNYSPHHLSTPTSTNSLIHRSSAIGATSASTAGNTPYLTKERIYDHQKYSSSSSLVNAGKMAYNANTGANISNSTMYDGHPQHHHQHMINNQTMGKAQTIDHHVINPSNLPTSKEQHPSPNYARKCPQMYTPEEQSTAHHHLYMSTPQFSSEKFTRASPQQPPPPSDFTNLRESPSGGSSHIQHQSCQDKYSPHAPLPPPHLRESPQFPGHSTMARNPPNSYYGATSNQNSSKILPPEMSPIIMKQTHTHYQYSKSPLPPPPVPLPPSSHLQQQSAIPPPSQMAAKSMQSHSNASSLAPPLPSQMGVVNNPQRYLIDNVKREDLEIYENPPNQQQQQPPTSRTTAGSSIYINPFNTPPPTGDICCKDVALSSSSSPYNTGSATPSYRVESPQFYPTKYGKLAMTEMAPNSTKQQNTSILNQNTPPPSRASSQRGGQHPANYYYEGNSHSAPSPAAATAASPSPSSLMATTSQTQMHHTEYITTLQGGPPIGPPPPAPMSIGHNMQQSYPTQATSAQHPHQQSLTASLRITDEMMTTQTATQSYDRTVPHHQSHLPTQQLLTKHVLPQHQPPTHNSSSLQIPQGSANAPSSSKLLTKHQKPNYRELINQKLAMRNATSEEELNMQIIKKTLNVDSQNVRNSPGHNPPISNRGIVMQHSTNNDRIPVSRDPLRTDVTMNSSGHKSGSVLVTNSSGAALPSSSRLIEVPLGESPRVCIKKEDDKPSSSTSTTTSSSPLDLSMRTVKTKADSTEYKYQQTQRLSCNTPSSSTERLEGRYTLPRVDSTPIFSVHAFEPAAAPIATHRQSTHSRHNSLERRNYTPPTHTSPAPIACSPSYQNTTTPHIPASSSLSHQNYPPNRRNDMPAQPTHSLQSYEKSLVIKSTTKSNNDLDIRPSQSRPSVLETNPYASVIKTEPKRLIDAAQPAIKQHPLAAVERLPPDTSIMALPSRNLPYTQQRTNMPAQHNTNISSSVINTTLSKYSSVTCEKNPNVRKRRLQEYSNQMSMQEPAIKQNRFIDLPIQHSTTTISKTQIPMRPADISVIAVNDSKIFEVEGTALKPNVNSKQNDIIATTGSMGGVIASSINATKVIVTNHHPLPVPTSAAPMVICKQEPLTPTGDNPSIKIPDVIVNNQQTNFSARIRTKAELKGFTFNPPPPTIQTSQTELNKASPVKELIIKQEEILDIKIKEELDVPTVSQIEMPSIPGLEDVYEERSLLDFGWSNTCNNLVEQLLTRPSPKKKSSINVNSKIVKEPYEMVVSSSDVVQGKKEQSLSNVESADNTTRSSFARLDAGLESGLTLNTVNQDSINSQNSGLIHKKLTKADREKKRFQQEKRLAERMKVKDSSSETEDELDKRKTDRLKKPIMKTKHKPKSPNSKGQQSDQSNNSSNGVTDKNRFSECGSDSSTTGGEEETTKSKSKPSEKLQIKVEKMDEDELEKKTDTKEKDKKDDLKTKVPEKCDKVIKNEKEQKKIEIDKSKKPSNSNTNNKTEKEIIKKETPTKQEIKPAKESSNSSTETDDEEDEEEEDEEDDEEEKQKEKVKIATKSKTNKTSNKGSFFKMSLHTMTRSKRKKELELQLANSKVLRNEKVIRNSSSTTNSSSNKIKRKYTRKYNTVNSLLESGGLSRESGIMKSTRLKAKLERNGGKLNIINNAKTKSNKLTADKDSGSAKALKNSKNPENVHERNVIDLYRFKRALKVPPSLINIKHPGAHKIAASLPDLERHAEALEAYAKKRKKHILKSKTKTQTDSSTNSALKKDRANAPAHQEEPKSIIDLLHSRVTKASGLNVHNKTTTTTAFKPLKPCCSTTNSSNNIKPPPASNTTANNCAMFSETSQTTESSELQMLPELRKDSDEDDDNDNDNESTNGKKRHFSIFDTKVLPTKTRTESKLQQKKENIREIFVGDDRPASAPPEITQSSDCLTEKMTYEQKYEQFLQKMNIVISADKFGRFGKSAAAKKLLPPNHTTDLNPLNIKQEEVDTESTSVIDADELKTDPLGNHIRKKRGKYLRRKGSSGFDYIRKKKKPTPASSTSGNNLNNGSISNLHFAIKSEKMEQEEYRYKIKTEDDVCREIQKWVLNKGVGQSTMHKAARQGYIDVIVYCLDRLGMNPDQKDNAGYTPLHEACTNGWLNIARVLLQYGANHSEAAHSGIRPLHEASENDYEEIVRLLLSYGADPLLATYSGQTPLMLAPSKTMRDILNNHLVDVQNMGPERKPWKFNGPWEIYDPAECGYNVFEGAPNYICDMSRALLRKGSLNNNQVFQNNKKLQVLNTNNTTTKTTTTAAAITSHTLSHAATSNNSTANGETPATCTSKSNGSSSTSTSSSSNSSNKTSSIQQQTLGTDVRPQHKKGETTIKTVMDMDKCTVLLDKIDRFDTVRCLNTDKKPEILIENSESDGEMFEFEEADILLPPLYLLKDEGTQDKWVLLSDLCNLLKVKSKDTLLNKIYPSTSSSVAPAHKSLMRELKMSDFLEKATCLQLLCAGEKLNICASKVVLLKYNENVRNLLGVKTILMKF